MPIALPVATWLPAYRRESLSADVVAGLSTAAVVIPQTMAYAVIAGIPVEAGLYTALAAMLVYPLLGTSRPLSVTTTSALAMLTSAEVVAISSRVTDVSATTVAGSLALLVGGILIVARLLRLGFLANFISIPVLAGFKAGVGVAIIVGQLKAVLGVSVVSKTTLGTLWELPRLLPQAHGATVLVALAGLAVLFSLARWFPRVSGPLVWVGLSIAASAVLGLAAMGVKTVGVFPPGLPSLAMPDLSLLELLWPAALGIALMSFTESVAAARTFCLRDDPPVDANRELFAIGAANVAASFVGGLPAGGGSSQTAVADESGARSQMAQWVNAAAVLVTLLLLSRVIGLLPKPALAALILVTAASMLVPAPFRAIARIRRMELAWAIVAMAGVIVVGTLNGILIAVAISVVTLFYQANHPPVYGVAYCRENGIFRRAGEHESDETFPGLLMVRTEGRLNFASAPHARAKMQALVAELQPQVIVLECSAIPDIEYTALVMLTEAEQNLRSRGVTLWLAALNPDLLKLVERSPLGATLGRDRMFFNLHTALEAWQQRRDTSLLQG